MKKPGIGVNKSNELQNFTTDDNAFLQKLSSSSSGVPIDSPHVIVFPNGTTIILRKMGLVHTIVLAKQFTHSRAPNVVLCYKIWTIMTPPSCRNYHPRRRVPSSIRRMWLRSPMVQPSSCTRWDPYIPSFSPNNSLIPGLQMLYYVVQEFGRRWLLALRTEVPTCIYVLQICRYV